MRWEDERYVRLYTRDTGDWLFLSFDAQALMMMLLRKVDRAGILHLGRHGEGAVSAVLGHTESHDRIGVALKILLADGSIQIDGSKLIIPNFIEAQEARISDAQRKRDQRERDRDKLVAAGIQGNSRSLDITARLDREVTHSVTNGHTESHEVTPSLAVPSLADPTKQETTDGGAQEKPALTPAVGETQTTPLLAYLAAEFPQALATLTNERKWLDAYPGLDLLAEAKKARSWELDNPKRAKPQKRRFLGGWFGRAHKDKRQNGAPDKIQANASGRRIVEPDPPWKQQGASSPEEFAEWAAMRRKLEAGA